ncbi:MAG: hypothetical protein J6K89_03975, partial [Oscillospiraceae bacterium]|nr:hypothetical protein [Oscillospiraceae bacterium]
DLRTFSVMVVHGPARRPFPTVLYETLVDKSEFRLSPLVRATENVVEQHPTMSGFPCEEHTISMDDNLYIVPTLLKVIT